MSYLSFVCAFKSNVFSRHSLQTNSNSNSNMSNSVATPHHHHCSSDACEYTIVKTEPNRFAIRPFTGRYSNQVMLMGMSAVLENVDPPNWTEGVDWVAALFRDPAYFDHLSAAADDPEANGRLWVLVDAHDDVDINSTAANKTGDKAFAYGYIAVRVDASTRVATLKGLFLHHSLRGSTCAARLLECAMDFARARGCNALECDVDGYNAAALQFYAKHEFVQVRTEAQNDGKMMLVYFRRSL
jgi:GNAT superfamily N-acetyltransferase